MAAMIDVEIRGGEDVAALVRRIKAHADAKAIRSELTKSLNRSTKPIRAAMKADIAPALPSRGGLAALVQAKASLTTSVRSRLTAGVSIRARHRAYDLRRLNAGMVRHPVFGDRETWVTQTAGITPGFLDKAFESGAADARREIQRAMDDIARKVEG